MAGAKGAKHHAISTNILQQLGMVMIAYVVVVQKSNHSNLVGAPVIMLADSVSAVAWVIEYGERVGCTVLRAGWCVEAGNTPRTGENRLG